MSEYITKEDKEGLIKKLDYLGLDFENLPDFLFEYSKLDFRPSKTYKEEMNYKVYQSIDVTQIQILLTPANRLDPLEEKFNLSAPIIHYLDQKEENIIKHTSFLEILKTLDIEEIQRIQKEQEFFNKKIPFKVKYNKNYLWQIYYSEYTNKYFMLVPTKETNNNAFFYLLKKQIELKDQKEDDKSTKIFVPISGMEYSGQYLRPSEITDLENYLWLFTKYWPIIHEIYNKRNILSIQIVGESKIYEGITSPYKIAIHNKEDAVKFYKLVKALFILQTELSKEYSFKVRINKEGGIDFYYQNQNITYEYLSNFIKQEFEAITTKLKEIFDEKTKYIKEKEKLLKISNEQYLEYLNKEKQITLFMECKKTFIGRVRYYFTTKKKTKSSSKDIIKKKREGIKKEKVEVPNDIIEVLEKDFYTIEDLIKQYKQYEKNIKQLKDDKLDMEALTLKIENMNMRIKNAEIYLKEIENHKKSIFEFWKFTKKDDVLSLNKAEEQIQEEKKMNLERTFQYEEDLEELGVEMDRIQTNVLTKKEEDAIYVANSEIIKDINIVFSYYKNNKRAKEMIINVVDQKTLEKSLKKQKEISVKERLLFNKGDFDIFGAISQDRTKIQMLSGKRHREPKKNLYQILDITEHTTLKDYITILCDSIDHILNALEKINTPVQLSIYQGAEEDKKVEGIENYHIKPEEAIIGVNKEEVYVNKINVSSNENMLFYSNIMFFDNNSKTLPKGMDLSDEVLLNCNNENFKKIAQDSFIINQEENYDISQKTIYLTEYKIE